MERGESPQHRARVIIVSQRTRSDATTRPASSTTLSLMPRWSSDRAVDMAARTFKDTDREAGRAG
jgi:hypothetical protein